MRGIPLGWESNSPSVFGFDRPASSSGEIICYDGDAPLCAIAPTGSGKGRDLLIPLLLTYPGPLIVVDLKGELSAVTARARLELGQSVHVLDPFGVTGRESDRLNPFDLFSLEGSMLEPDAEMIASLLGDGHASKDPFWSDTASGLIAGLIAYVATCPPPEPRNMKALRSLLYSDDTTYALAVLLDTKGKAMPSYAYAEISAFLQHADPPTRPSVLATARSYLKAMNTDQVSACLGDSTVSLRGVVEGSPQTVYLTIPPEKLRSHRCLLRAWVAVLLTAVMRRREIPDRRTLFVLDEAAQLGTFDPLLTAATLLRGYGVQLVSVWQDLAQMKSLYPQDWSSILNNSAVLLAFGFGHYSACRDYAEVLGLDAGDLMRLAPDEAALSVRGEGTRKVRRLNYLRDAMFQGLADPNPYYRRHSR
ncbi:Conjugal transfer protein TraG [Aquisphaera giovannonii]|uniref:Conjugal transfer protein TraG n=1 Tax=Aquisphaera giovannonii TaxID=406548 RepID=A0A5B9W8B3_9BACT|nr:type IV secretory system conjugative DNA transfer family protein [Aquisphaera giovannonii]QEH36474.1 Conjugal transfer protein TraG [Aquisphaera giovannonii]